MSSLSLLPAVAEAMREILGLPTERPLRLLVAGGWEGDGSRRAVLGFPDGADRPALVAKVATGSGGDVLRSELANLRVLEGCSPELRRSVPRVLAELELDGASGLVETAARGEPLSHRLDAASVGEWAERGGRWVELFAGDTAARRRLDRADVDRLLLAPLRGCLEVLRTDRAERALLERCVDEAEGLVGSTLPLGPEHGDLCAPNVFASGADVEVIDWEEPFRPALPAGDLIHLVACLVHDTGDCGAVEAFDAAFFRDGAAAPARAPLVSLARALEVPGELLRLLFVAWWARYALEKVELAGRGRLPEGTWGLVDLDERRCLNLAHLARHEGRLDLP